MEEGGIMENKDGNKQKDFNPAIREDGRLNYPESGIRPCGFFEAVGEATGLKNAINQASVWTCSACGHTGNEGKFCEECGASKPPVVIVGGIIS